MADQPLSTRVAARINEFGSGACFVLGSETEVQQLSKPKVALVDTTGNKHRFRCLVNKNANPNELAGLPEWAKSGTLFTIKFYSPSGLAIEEVARQIDAYFFGKGVRRIDKGQPPWGKPPNPSKKESRTRGPLGVAPQA